MSGKLLYFFVQRKYMNKSEKRRTHGYTNKRLSFFFTRDTRLINRNITVLILWAPVNYKSTVCHGGSKSLFLSYVHPFFRPLQSYNPLSTRGNSLSIFQGE